MEIKSFTFSTFNDYASKGIAQALKQCTLNKQNKKHGAPVVVCIGSDLVLGDSLGPLVGTFICDNKFNGYVYGTLTSPITAKEIGYTKTLLKKAHPNSLVISIDAAVGDDEDVGLIRVANCGLKPGLGVAKSLGTIGDISIMGIVAGRSTKNYNLFNLTRLGFVYKMAQTITNGINEYLNSQSNVGDLTTQTKTKIVKAFIPSEDELTDQTQDENGFLFGS